MENIKQHDHRTTRRPDCVTEIRMGNTVLVVSGFFKKDTTSTAADKMARVLAKLRLRFCIQLLHTGFALPGAVTLWKKMKELILECMSMHEEVVMTGFGDG